MSATAIIVSFIAGTTEAAFCSVPMPLEMAQILVQKIATPDWKFTHPGFTPPNYIIRGHPNYNDALQGKIIDDPLTGETKTVPPCKPFP